MKFRFKLALQMALWVYASAKLGRNDCDAALRTLLRMERLDHLMPAQKVFKGTVLLIAGRYEEAKAIWREVVESCGSDLSPNSRYAFLMARANLHAVAGDLDLCDADEREAANLRCSEIVQRLLPGPRFIGANDR